MLAAIREKICGGKKKQQTARQIMEDIREFLIKKGHKCVTIVGTGKDSQLQWCQQDVCTKIEQLFDMKRRQKEEDAKVDALVAKGHTCITIMETYPSFHTWCEQEPCTGRSA